MKKRILKIFTKEYILGGQTICFIESFNHNTTKCMISRIEYQGLSSKWSDEIEFTVPEFKACVWKECPEYVERGMKYSVDVNNPRIAYKTDHKWGYCTIISNAPLPLNMATSWSIKILKSRGNDGKDIYIGVAPFDINQNEYYNFNKCGWYFRCYDSTLYSEPPHNYDYKKYGPRKEIEKYVKTGDIVGVVMDTTKGELSFVLSGGELWYCI